MYLLGFFVFTVSKAPAEKLVVFPTMFFPSCNKKKHIGVITGCKINDVLVTQNTVHGPANIDIAWEVFVFLFFKKCRLAGPSPDLQNQKPHFNKSPRALVCTVKLEKLIWVLEVWAAVFDLLAFWLHLLRLCDR